MSQDYNISTMEACETTMEACELVDVAVQTDQLVQDNPSISETPKMQIERSISIVDILNSDCSIEQNTS